MPDAQSELNLVDQPEREREPPKRELVPLVEQAKEQANVSLGRPFNLEEEREKARGDLARGLLVLLSFSVGGVLLFIGMGRLEGSVLAQSIFPSLIALAGTALGFYFGSQSPQASGAGQTPSGQGGSPPAPPTVVVQPPPVQVPPIQAPVQSPPGSPPLGVL